MNRTETHEELVARLASGTYGFHLIQVKHALGLEARRGILVAGRSVLPIAKQCGYTTADDAAGAYAEVTALLEEVMVARSRG